jgi:hypothetical protein
MKTASFAWLLVCGLSVAMVSGCGHRSNAKEELEKAASTLGKAEPDPVPQTPAPAVEAVAPESVPVAASLGSVADPAPSPARQMQQALVAYKGGELEDAVTRLQKLRMTPTLTAQQRMAVQDSVAAVMGEIYSLAEKGDAKAIQAVRQYEEMQTSRH